MKQIKTAQSLESRIAKIEDRNQKVEVDKQWEQSATRKLLIVLFTYLSIGLYMWVIGTESPFLNAIIPALGFTLSTLTLPMFKESWLRRRGVHSSHTSVPQNSSIVFKLPKSTAIGYNKRSGKK